MLASYTRLTIGGVEVKGFESVDFKPNPPARIYAGCDFAAGPSWSATFTIRTDRRFRGRGRDAYRRRCAYRFFRSLGRA